MTKYILIVALVLAIALPAFAGPLWDEITAVLQPLVPDEMSGAFALELRPDGIQASDGHVLLMGNYALVHLIGKPAFFDVWRPSPLGIGVSYKLTGTDYRFGVGFDKKLDCFLVYFRQGIELDLDL